MLKSAAIATLSNHIKIIQNTPEANTSFGRKPWLEVKIGTMAPDCM